MSDLPADRKAEIERVRASANRVAQRMSQSFVLDPVKLEQFVGTQPSGKAGSSGGEPPANIQRAAAGPQ